MQSSRLRIACTMLAVFSYAFASVPFASALPPAPANDEPANAEVIDPNVPSIVYGTTVLANDSISTTSLPAPVNDVDGPDVFYSFTPGASDTYRIELLPWQHAPLRSSDRRFILYVQDDEGGSLVGAEAPGSARPVHVDVALTAGFTYRIAVDYDAAAHDNFPFTLIVDTLSASAPDDCAGAEDLGTDLPHAVLNNIDGAVADYSFVQGTGTCAVSGASPTTAAGPDHVYRFTPTVTGEYAFELAVSGFDGVLYINDSCPPVFPGGCLGASNHSTGGSSGGKHELIAVSLAAGTDYYVYVDTGTAGAATGQYALIVDTAFNYEINEMEPNDSPGTAFALDTPLNGGQLVGPADVDYWAVAGSTGDKVYAWVNNGGSTNSTLDTDLTFLASDGTTIIEFDDEDADGADAPIEDLRYIYATSAPVIAGARMTSPGTHYLLVSKQSATGTVHRYRMHTGVVPATRAPLDECEPNNTLSSADFTGKQHFAGVIEESSDIDFYTFEAEIGDRVFIACDGDPERDATGFDSANTDPRAFHARLAVYDPAGDILISDASDSNSIQSGPDYPAQGAYFVARSTGRHYVSVEPQSSASQVGPEETYEVAIFINESAPILSEENDPALMVTPDFLANEIDVTATDALPGDTGICDVTLVDVSNVELTNLSFVPGDGSVDFTVSLINGTESGFAKLQVSDCEGNTSCEITKIDVNPPLCDGINFSQRLRTASGPIHVPDNEPSGPGIQSPIDISSPGLVSDVNVTLTIETIRPPDIDCFLISSEGTVVELFTDRGTSLEFDITDATFDDDAEEILPILSAESPYTGTWLPEDPAGLSQLNGESAMGSWRLQVIDDSSSANGGARLVEWRLDLLASFPGPESFAGTVTDLQGFDCGIASIELSGATNLALELPPDFAAGDLVVDYVVSLNDPSQDGSGTITVTDLAENICTSPIVLSGLPDTTEPVNDGQNTTARRYAAEVQASVPGGVPSGVISTINVGETALVGEVEVDLTIDTKEIGRLASTLSHDGEFTALINRVGMDSGSLGLTKDVIDITLDDDAPEEDDAHEEPALGSVEFFGPHQPDGRGDFIGDAIATDPRDNMLFTLAGLDAMGDWDLFVGDFRIQGASGAESVFRRWSMTIDSPCAAEHFTATATDLAPGAGICSIAVATGSDNIAVGSSFTPGDETVDYEVTLIDDSLPGNGIVEIEDCAGNIRQVPINLNASSGDTSLPVVSGTVNQGTFEFEGTASDDQAGDTGIVAVELAPYSDNLQLLSVIPAPPNGAGTVDFVVGMIDGNTNGRGYVRVIDSCGLRNVALVEIDATTPVCSGEVTLTKRYVAEELPSPIPDNSISGVISSITVPDADIIEDVNVTLNITHPFADDIEAQILNPQVINLFSDIGLTGNDFIDTTLDDEAAAPITDSPSAAPWTGSFQPEGGPALFALDGMAANGTYTLRIIDDAVFNVGSLDGWAMTIESSTFPPRYDGRVEDAEALASGICNVALLPGSTNVQLTTDLFTAGDGIVRYSVELDCAVNDGIGNGTVRVTDCAGNTCDVPVALSCDACPEVESPTATSVGVCVDDNDCATTAICVDGGCYAPKNRYLTLTPGNGGTLTAIRLTHVESGRQWWVGNPDENDVALLLNDIGPGLYRDWSDTSVLQIADCGIAPGQSYNLQAISVDCDIADESAYSDALALITSELWGDVSGDFDSGAWEPPNGAVNFVDIQSTVQGFQNVPTAPPLSWLDVGPEVPNQVINFVDIQRVVQAFQNEAYPFADPNDCP